LNLNQFLAYLLPSIIVVTLVSEFIPRGNSISYASATQRIISPSLGWPTLFRLNVTYPVEAKTGENFTIYIQLWQGKNTNVSVRSIQVSMSGNMSQILLNDQRLENPTQNETLVVDRTLAISVQKNMRWYISVWYSVKDLNFGGMWIIGHNSLALFIVYPQTHNEVTSQLSDAQKQVTDLENQKIGLAFICAYLAVTLGIAVPIIQRRRNKKPKETNNEKEQGRTLI